MSVMDRTSARKKRNGPSGLDLRDGLLAFLLIDIKYRDGSTRGGKC
jgi:hypothetical protein